MPGNYGLNGNDWYNQRLNQIASMMSMQNTDPSFLAGALIGDILRTPFQNWIDNKVLPTLTGGGNSNNGSSNSNDTQFQQVNGTYQAEPTANNPATTGNRQTDVTIASLMPNQQGNVSFANTVQPGMDMDFTHLGQAQAQQSPPTQAEINEATNNATNQAVTQEAQRQGNMQGIMDNLGQGAINSAVANAFGISPFQQASSLGNGGEASYDEAMQNALLREIYKAKQDYAIAQQNNDTEGMQRANDAANLVRQMAQEYGIDVSAGDSDVTIDSLANTMMREQERQQQEANQREAEMLRNLTPQELLNNPEINISPNAFYQRAYQELNSRGIPEYRARQRAADMAMQYEANYMTAMQNEFNTQGIDPNTGAMNAAGIDTIMRMAAANNPEIAQMLMSQYASPRDTWGFARDIDKAKLNEQLREQLSLYNYQNIDVPKMAYNAQLTDQLNERNSARQVDAQMQLIDARARAAGLSEMAILNAKSQYISGLVANGAITPEMGTAAMASLLGLGGGRSSNTGYNLTPKEQVKLEADTTSIINDTMRRIKTEPQEDGEKAINEYAKEIDKLIPQYEAAGDTDTAEELRALQFVFNFARQDLTDNTQSALELYKSFRYNDALKYYLQGFNLDKYERLAMQEDKKQRENANKNEDSSSGNNTGGIYFRRADAER